MKTSLYDLHVSLGARMVPFAGYSMPVQYTSIVEEHKTVRTAAGLFDLGHMGRLLISGPDRVAFLDSLVTNKLADLDNGQARYALMCNEHGCVLDDVIYYMYPELIMLVVNASNRPKIWAWLEQNRGGHEVVLEDLTDAWGMIALQGPKAREILEPLCDIDPLKSIKNYRARGGSVLGVPCHVARTGYTGEIGYELYFEASRAEHLFSRLLACGAEAGLKPCGLGARDTLRLEAGMPLYGHELDEETNPLETGLSFALRLDKGEFMGRAALQAVAEAGPAKQLLGFFSEGRRVPRQGHKIYRTGTEEACGVVTSGTFSPTLGRGVCMAFVESPLGEADAFEVDLGRKRLALTQTKLPFYKRTTKKKKKKAKTAPTDGA